MPLIVDVAKVGDTVKSGLVVDDEATVGDVLKQAKISVGKTDEITLDGEVVNKDDLVNETGVTIFVAPGRVAGG